MERIPSNQIWPKDEKQRQPDKAKVHTQIHWSASTLGAKLSWTQNVKTCKCLSKSRQRVYLAAQGCDAPLGAEQSTCNNTEHRTNIGNLCEFSRKKKSSIHHLLGLEYFSLYLEFFLFEF